MLMFGDEKDYVKWQERNKMENVLSNCFLQKSTINESNQKVKSILEIENHLVDIFLE